MREGSPNQLAATDLGNSPQSAAKSLFRHILDVSSCGSIFYPDSGISPTHKLLRISTLGESIKK